MSSSTIANFNLSTMRFEKIITTQQLRPYEKWTVCLESMTCTYYDKSGNKVLVEKIPG
jgi:hypothetical protein